MYNSNLSLGSVHLNPSASTFVPRYVELTDSPQVEENNQAEVESFHLLDRELKKLVEQEILDKQLKIKINPPFPLLHRATLIDIVNLLTAPFIVRGKIRQILDSKKEENYTFEKEIILAKILAVFVDKKIEIVGSTVFWLLRHHLEKLLKIMGVENSQEILDLPNLKNWHQEPIDLDIRLEDLFATEHDLWNYCNEVKDLLAKECNQPLEIIHDTGLIKLHSEFDQDVEGNRFTIITIGNQKGKNAEFIFTNHLRREHLFTLDALRLPINSLIQALKENNFEAKSAIEAIDQGKYDQEIELQSDYPNLWQPLIDRIFGLLRADKLETINASGFVALITHLSKGRRGYQEGLEQTLFNTFKQARGPKKLVEFLAEQLRKCLINHHFSHPVAAFILTFQTCLLLYKENEEAVLPLWKELTPLFNDSSLELIQEVNAFILNKTAFKEIGAFLHLKYFMSLFVRNSVSTVSLIKDKSSEKLGLQIEIEGQYLLIPHQLSITLEVLGHCRNRELLTKLKNFLIQQEFCTVTKSLVEKSIVSQSQAQKIQELSTSETKELQTIGIYLSLLYGILCQNSMTFSTLLDPMPSILEQDVLIKNILLLPLTKEEEKLICNFQQLTHENKKMRWAQALAETGKEEWVYRAYALWEKLRHRNIEESIEFAKAMAYTRPDLSLKIVQIAPIPIDQLYPVIHQILEICKNGRKLFRLKDLPCLSQGLSPFLVKVPSSQENFLNSLDWLALELLDKNFYDQFFNFINQSLFFTKSQNFWLRCIEKLNDFPSEAFLLWQYFYNHQIFKNSQLDGYFAFLVNIMRIELTQSSSFFKTILQEYVKQNSLVSNRLFWLENSILEKMKALPLTLLKEKVDSLTEELLNHQPTSQEIISLIEVYTHLTALPLDSWQTLFSKIPKLQSLYLKAETWKFLQQTYFENQIAHKKDKLMTFFLQLIKAVEVNSQHLQLLKMRQQLDQTKPSLALLDSELIQVFVNTKQPKLLNLACELAKDLLKAPIKQEKKQKILSSIVTAIAQTVTFSLNAALDDSIFTSLLELIEQVKEDKERGKIIKTMLIAFKACSNRAMLKEITSIFKRFLEDKKTPLSFLQEVDSFLEQLMKIDQDYFFFDIKEILKLIAIHHPLETLNVSIALLIKNIQNALELRENSDFFPLFTFISHDLSTFKKDYPLMTAIQQLLSQLLLEMEKRGLLIAENAHALLLTQLENKLTKQKERAWKIAIYRDLMSQYALKAKRQLVPELYSFLTELIEAKEKSLDFIELLNLVVFTSFSTAEDFKSHLAFIKEKVPRALENCDYPHKGLLYLACLYVNHPVSLSLSKSKQAPLDQMFDELLAQGLTGIKEAFLFVYQSDQLLFEKNPKLLENLHIKAWDHFHKIPLPAVEKFAYAQQQVEIVSNKLKDKNKIWINSAASSCSLVLTNLLNYIDNVDSFKKFNDLLLNIILYKYFKNDASSYLKIINVLIKKANEYFKIKEFLTQCVDKLSLLLIQDPLEQQNKLQLLNDWIKKLTSLRLAEANSLAQNSLVLAKANPSFFSNHKIVQQLGDYLLKSHLQLSIDEFKLLSLKAVRDPLKFFTFCGWQKNPPLEFNTYLQNFLNQIFNKVDELNKFQLIEKVLEDSFILVKEEKYRAEYSNFWIKWAQYLVTHHELTSCHLGKLIEREIEIPYISINPEQINLIISFITKISGKNFISYFYDIKTIIQKLNINLEINEILEKDKKRLAEALYLRLNQLIEEKYWNFFYEEHSYIEKNWLDQEKKISLELKVISCSLSLENYLEHAEHLVKMIENWGHQPDFLNSFLQDTLLQLVQFLNQNAKADTAFILMEIYKSHFPHDQSYSHQLSVGIVTEEDALINEILEGDQATTLVQETEIMLKILSQYNLTATSEAQQQKIIKLLKSCLPLSEFKEDCMKIWHKLELDQVKNSKDLADLMHIALAHQNRLEIEKIYLFISTKLDHFCLNSFNYYFLEQLIQLLEYMIEHYFLEYYCSIAKVLADLIRPLNKKPALGSLWFSFLKSLRNHQFAQSYIQNIRLEKTELNKQKSNLSNCKLYKLINLTLCIIPHVYTGDKELLKELDDFLFIILEDLFIYNFYLYKEKEKELWNQLNHQLFIRVYKNKSLEDQTKVNYQKLNENIQDLLRLDQPVDRKTVFGCESISYSRELFEYKLPFYLHMIEHLNSSKINEHNIEIQNVIKQQKSFLVTEGCSTILTYIMKLAKRDKNNPKDTQKVDQFRDIIDAFIFQSFPVYCTSLVDPYLKNCYEIIKQATAAAILNREQCNGYLSFLLPLAPLSIPLFDNYSSLFQQVNSNFSRDIGINKIELFEPSLHHFLQFDCINGFKSALTLFQLPIMEEIVKNKAIFERCVNFIIARYGSTLNEYEPALNLLLNLAFIIFNLKIDFSLIKTFFFKILTTILNENTTFLSYANANAFLTLSYGSISLSMHEELLFDLAEKMIEKMEYCHLVENNNTYYLLIYTKYLPLQHPKKNRSFQSLEKSLVKAKELNNEELIKFFEQFLPMI